MQILYVCLGNICRSPAAQAILEKKISLSKISQLRVLSCGLGNWHIGESADPRMLQISYQRGYPISSRAQQISPDLVNGSEWIFAADRSVYHEILKMHPHLEKENKLLMMTAFHPLSPNIDVPDPYFGGLEGFDAVITLLEESCDGFMEELKKRTFYE